MTNRLKFAWCTLWFAITVGLAATGCTYLKHLVGLGPVRPRVELLNIEVEKLSFSSLNMILVLQIDNPNSFDLRFSKLRYSLAVADIDVARGTYENSIVIAQESRETVKLPLSVDTKSLLKLIQHLMQSPDNSYAVLAATSLFETPLGPMEVSVQDRKKLTSIKTY